ncbi:MAG: PTS sugar transporter [Deltaproteobacteria bacterium]|jgi:PTS system mannose-specific IIA component|nr:PTS sugar transporter [Deltaproteobacteria bacterium]MBW2511749.1 PTS sugar transporter [Deltaproteobacteria bacterium]
MIGLVVATHGNLGSELLLSAQMIIGPVINARSVSITHDSSMEAIRDAIAEAVTEVGKDDHGVIIVTDMFGGTPANVSMTFLEPQSVEVITGVNLPMILKFFNSQESLGLDELAGILKSYGQQSIALASEYLQR